jgi:hypothetical protein
VQRPAPRWTVRGLIPATELVVVYGQAGSGKSFLTLDIAAAVQQGEPWRGLKVRQGDTCYIAAEGAGGFRNRLEAYRRHHETQLDRLHVIPAAPNLLKVDQVKSLAAAINAAGRFALIVVDTLAQAIPGADENSAEDMGTLVASCKALHRLTRATIVLVHHAGKDPARGMRGSSAVQGACDAVIEVTRQNGQRLATVAKLKDGADGARYAFRLEVIAVGEDEEGEIIDSCVVEHQAEVKRARRAPKGKNERLVLETMGDLLGLAEGGLVGVGEVLDSAVGRLPQDPGKRDRRREVAMRAIESLVAGQWLELEGGKLRMGLCA